MDNQEQNNFGEVQTTHTETVQKPGLYTAGLILGIIGLCMFWLSWVGLICGILAIVFGAVAFNKGYKNKTPIILGSVAVGLVILMLIIASIVGLSLFNNQKNKANKMIDEIYEKTGIDRATDTINETKEKIDDVEKKQEEMNNALDEFNRIKEEATQNSQDDSNQIESTTEDLINSVTERINETTNR